MKHNYSGPGFTMQAISPAIGLFLLLGSALSQSAEPVDMPDMCKAPTAGQQIVYCKAVELKTSNQRVGELFAKGLKDYRANDMEILSKNGLPLAAPDFKKSQTSWIAFKESSCKAEYNYTGRGTLREIEYLDCLLRFNKKRIEELSH